VLFIVDGDMTDTEVQALRTLAAQNRPLVLVLNKVDRYSRAEREVLMESLRLHSTGLVDPRNLVATSAAPPEQLVLMVDEQGQETETVRQRPPDVAGLKERLWQILEGEGKTLAALNAGLFAGDLTERVSERMLAVRRELGARRWP
jgi:GTP-binding protein Era